MKISRLEKKLLSIIYINNLLKKNSLKYIQKQLDIEKKSIIKYLENLKSIGLIKEYKKKYFLTEKGRKNIKIVFTGGVYDIIHPGHVYTLKKSKEQGDLLIVSIARDNRVKKIKGNPVNNEKKRLTLVSAIKYVDFTILGSKIDIFKIVIKIKPDIITIGYDQKHQLSELRRLSKINKLKIKIVRLNSPMPYVKSSRLIKSNIQE